MSIGREFQRTDAAKQETSVDQRWNNETTEQGVNGWTMTDVGDDQVGLQYGLAGSARDTS